jgi:hypothetical protein
MLFLHRQTQRRRRFLLPRIGVLVLGPLYLRWLGLVEEADEALILNLVTLGLGWILTGRKSPTRTGGWRRRC